MFDEDVHTGGLQRDESDSEGEGSFHDNDAESSEEEPEKVKKGDLEWDDSTLSFWFDLPRSSHLVEGTFCTAQVGQYWV